MTAEISIISVVAQKDAAGFATPQETVVATVRACREDKHGSERWANMAVFASATATFRFRSIPGVSITTAHIIRCGGAQFNILSVENVRGRGMYVEAVCEEVRPSV